MQKDIFRNLYFWDEVSQKARIFCHTERLPIASGSLCGKYEGDEQGTRMAGNCERWKLGKRK
jgi:hypothetical protein